MKVMEKFKNFYRIRSQMVTNTTAKGGKASDATWFLKGNVTTTLTTMATPGSWLKNRLQSTLKVVQSPDRGVTKVIEASGISITKEDKSLQDRMVSL
jgi:hypothetical protein